jgi:hypothetical protein
MFRFVLKVFVLLWCSVCGAVDKIDLGSLDSPILVQGDDRHAYRDPAVVYENGVFFLFYTYVEIEEDDRIYSYTAFRKSRNLKTWSQQKIITPKDQTLNYCSPGNVVRFENQWVLCLQTYPRPGYVKEQIPRYGDGTARIFIMRSSDLETWSEPELLRVKGPKVPREKMGRMIDAYLVEDKDQPGKWWCFYKQSGASMSWSRDLKEWTYFDRVTAGENACVIVQDGRYYLFHSPANGIGIKTSNDLKQWHDWGELITLGQRDWEWAKGRLTAGFVLDMRKDRRVGKYLLFFHGSGPESERKHFDSHASLGIAWSDDLKNWDWPGKN